MTILCFCKKNVCGRFFIYCYLVVRQCDQDLSSLRQHLSFTQSQLGITQAQLSAIQAQLAEAKHRHAQEQAKSSRLEQELEQRRRREGDWGDERVRLVLR